MNPSLRSPQYPSRRAEEAGSTYILVLLVLVVLTIVGLSVTLITQTEMQIGANERTQQRVFYAAESGIANSTARVLVTSDHREQTYTLTEPDNAPALNIGNRVEVSTFFPILSAPCNLCEINDAGQYGNKQYFQVNHGVTALATRQVGSNQTPMAEKTLSAMIELQPWRPVPESLLATDDPAKLEKIKF